MDIRLSMTSNFMLIVERCEACVYFKATLVILAREFYHRTITFTRAVDLYRAIGNFRISASYYNTYSIFSSGDLLPLFYDLAHVFGSPSQYDILIPVVPIIILPRCFLTLPQLRNVSYYRWGRQHYTKIEVHQNLYVNVGRLAAIGHRQESPNAVNQQGRGGRQLCNNYQNASVSASEELTLQFSQSLNVEIFHEPIMERSNQGWTMSQSGNAPLGQNGLGNPSNSEALLPGTPGNIFPNVVSQVPPTNSVTPRANNVRLGLELPRENFPTYGTINPGSSPNQPRNGMARANSAPIEDFDIAMENFIAESVLPQSFESLTSSEPNLPNLASFTEEQMNAYENMLMEQLLDFEDDLEQAQEVFEEQIRNGNGGPKNGDNMGSF